MTAAALPLPGIEDVVAGRPAHEVPAGDDPMVALTSAPPARSEDCDHGWTFSVGRNSPDGPSWKCNRCGQTFAFGSRPDGHPDSAWGREQAARSMPPFGGAR